MISVALGLGSNLGDREVLIRDALSRIGQLVGPVAAVSPLYETEPWGVVDQPRFLNAVCIVSTRLCPLRLLTALQSIEAALGRVRTRRYGPRTIDLDILSSGDVVMSTPRLTIPHPGMLDRASVLVPMRDVAPDTRHPLTGRTIESHLRDLEPTHGVAPFPPGLSARS